MSISSDLLFIEHIMAEHTVSIHKVLRVVSEPTRVQAWTTTCVFTTRLQVDDWSDARPVSPEH